MRKAGEVEPVLVGLDGKQWSLQGRKSFVIGAHPEDDIVMPLPGVEAAHARLEHQNGEWLLRPLRGKVLVAGRTVSALAMRLGQAISLGSAVVRLLLPHEIGAQMRGCAANYQHMLRTVLRAATSDCNVLVLGETGTGKELVARTLHDSSARRQGPFVAVNCGAVPRELLAAELFGHERGAFTGAVGDRQGLFAAAQGGTLFLDEIGELPLEAQPHLLRVLETRTVRPIGAANERPVDVRVVAATHQRQGLGAPHGKLRVDLFHRLAAVIVELPALRERAVDIEPLLEAFLSELGVATASRLPPRVRAALVAYSWPGNIRELRQAVTRAAALGGEVLALDDFLPRGHRGLAHTLPVLNSSTQPQLAPYEQTLRESMVQAYQVNGSLRKAAAALGMPKSTFADRARAYGLGMRKGVRRSRPREVPAPEDGALDVGVDAAGVAS